MSEDEVLPLKGIAMLLRMAERTAFMWVQRGDPPGFGVGGQRLFKSADLKAWIGSQKPITARRDVTGKGG